MLEMDRRVAVLEIYRRVTSPQDIKCQISEQQQSADFANSILVVHNRERAAVSIPPLKWSDSLANEAKIWAEHLATSMRPPFSQTRVRTLQALTRLRGYQPQVRDRNYGPPKRVGLLRRDPSRMRICILSAITSRWSHLPRPTSDAGPRVVVVIHTAFWSAATTVACFRRSRTYHRSCQGQPGRS